MSDKIKGILITFARGATLNTAGSKYVWWFCYCSRGLVFFTSSLESRIVFKQETLTDWRLLEVVQHMHIRIFGTSFGELLFLFSEDRSLAHQQYNYMVLAFLSWCPSPHTLSVAEW